MGHVICKAMGGSNDRGALWIIMPNQKDIYIHTYIYIIIIIVFYYYYYDYYYYYYYYFTYVHMCIYI